MNWDQSYIIGFYGRFATFTDSTEFQFTHRDFEPPIIIIIIIIIIIPTGLFFSFIIIFW